MVGGHFIQISPQNETKSQTKIASAHIHIPRNNPAKFQNYLKNSSRGVADKGPLYIYLYQRNGWGAFPPKIPSK